MKTLDNKKLNEVLCTLIIILLIGVSTTFLGMHISVTLLTVMGVILSLEAFIVLLALFTTKIANSSDDKSTTS